MSPQSRYKILLIEPSPIVARGLKDALSAQNDFEVVDTLVDTSHLFERMVVLAPDIIVINPSIFNHSRKVSIRDISPSFADVALVSISYSVHSEELLRQFDDNISIFDNTQQIVRKLRLVIDQRAIESDSPTSSAVAYDLSEREKEILICIARGMTNKEIADLNNISVHTAISHRKNITRKTGIKTVSGLTIYALLNGLIDGASQ